MKIYAAIKDPSDECLDIINHLSEAQKLSSYLEDYYFGELEADYFIKLSTVIDKALKQARQNLLKITVE